MTELHPVASMHQQHILSVDDKDSSEGIKWVEIIFLPFHPVFAFIVLITVIVKCVMGPLVAVYNVVLCSEIMNEDILLYYVKIFYLYIADFIYFIDTFLHIVHRQVENEARKKEHMPKSALLILLDILSLIPLYALMMPKDSCKKRAEFWPNILAFNEMLPIYRVVQYFTLETNSVWRLSFGYFTTVSLAINGISCFFLLLTFEGLCDTCTKAIHDWRANVYRKFVKPTNVQTYYYGLIYVMNYAFRNIVFRMEPLNTSELIICTVLTITGYFFWNNFSIPRFFSEGLLRNRRIFSFTPRVVRIIHEAKRRNPSPMAYKEVALFYSILWKKRQGIISTPKAISLLPRYLSINIRQDLTWAVFYHSPVFRKTTSPYKRWLSGMINLEFKLPGERFYTGSHCFTNLYYIKSGVVQIFSADDCTSPMLSVTSGTVFGDCSFIIPAINRKLIVRCLTYCEVFIVSRTNVLTSLHKFPQDRRIIMNQVLGKVKHARQLYKTKQRVRGVDRAVDEGVQWIKTRWWEIANSIKRSKRSEVEVKWEMPPEEKDYHCAKYIGQLVLCKEELLRKSSMFVNMSFPYLLAPHTTLGFYWHSIIYVSAWITMFVFPPNIAKVKEGSHPVWFSYVASFIEVIYLIDLGVSLITSVEKQDHSTFTSVLKYRLKDPYFIVDILSSPILDFMLHLIIDPSHNYVLHFNNLLKTYVLFVNTYENKWRKKQDPVKTLLYNIIVVHVIFMYVFPYVLYTIHTAAIDAGVRGLPSLVIEECIKNQTTGNKTCYTKFGVFSVVVGFNIFMYSFQKSENITQKGTLEIIILMIFVIINYMIYIYTRSAYISGLYLKYKNEMKYSHYVSNLKKYFNEHNLHPDLMARLERHLECHWKYFKGMDILHPNPLQDEPYDIFWRHHGEIAEKTVSESQAFKGADPALIRDLIHKTRFMILPRNSTLILFGLQIRTIMWLLNGSLQCEYHNSDNELERKYVSPVKLISFSSIFLDRAPIITYIAVSDCEMLYIPYQDYIGVLQHYPEEKFYFDNCANEIRPLYEDLLRTSLIRNAEYQKKLREKILHNKKFSSVVMVKKKILGRDKSGRLTLLKFFYDYRTDPESSFILCWMNFRAIIVVLGVIIAACEAIFIDAYLNLIILGWMINLFGLLDILIKLFLPYYNEKGIMINAKKECVYHYLSRGFLVDVFANTNVFRILGLYLDKDDEGVLIAIKVFTKLSQIYLFTGCLNYKIDSPTVLSAVYMIFKYQVVIILVLITGAVYFLAECVEYEVNGMSVNISKHPTCWVPKAMNMPRNITKGDLLYIAGLSASMVQYGFFRMAFDFWTLEIDNYIPMTFVFLLVGLIYWLCICKSQIIAVLFFRGDTLFQQNLTQLKLFLESERVEKHLIHSVMEHFDYWFQRTKGVNVQYLLTERIGVVFRQDLNYYFYKTTLEGADTLLGGGEVLQRNLVGHASQVFYLRNQDITRENDLSKNLYFVHRGKVGVYRGAKKIAELTKGSIFGQTDAKKLRPIRITTRSEENTDLLIISIDHFHENITDKIRRNIASIPESKFDYMPMKNLIFDDPKSTIEYMLRGSKVIKFPRMNSYFKADKSRKFYVFVLISWFLGPVVTAFMVVMNSTVEPDDLTILTYLMVCLILLDFVFVAYLISEFFTMVLTVVGDKCVYKQMWRKKFLDPWLYVNILSLLLPIVAIWPKYWKFGLSRLARLHLPVRFHQRYCRNVRNAYMSTLVKISIFVLFLHILTCFYVDIGCKSNESIPALPPILDKYWDPKSWRDPNERQGCHRVFNMFFENNTFQRIVVVPSTWIADYTTAFFSMVSLLTKTNSVLAYPLTMSGTFFKLFACVLIGLVDLYICSLAVSNYYMKYREKCRFDSEVSDLIQCLKFNGLSEILVQSVKDYTDKSWERQKGGWLPKITLEAPLCLQQDIMAALYMHHLKTPTLFQNLPPYFLRQLVTRLSRIVVFPENRIIREGDIFPRIYFIHEGEVEKWYVDESGEIRMGSLLSTNGYFGLIPGLFPNTPYQFTYYSRTVVDLVFLDFDAWQDLLNGYPDVKRRLYSVARQAKMAGRKMTLNQ